MTPSDNGLRDYAQVLASAHVQNAHSEKMPNFPGMFLVAHVLPTYQPHELTGFRTFPVGSFWIKGAWWDHTLSLLLFSDPNHRQETGMLKNFLLDETGAELAEYAVAVALLVAVALVVYQVLGQGINDANESTAAEIQNPTIVIE